MRAPAGGGPNPGHAGSVAGTRVAQARRTECGTRHRRLRLKAPMGTGMATGCRPPVPRRYRQTFSARRLSWWPADQGAEGRTGARTRGATAGLLAETPTVQGDAHTRGGRVAAARVMVQSPGARPGRAVSFSANLLSDKAWRVAGRSGCGRAGRAEGAGHHGGPGRAKPLRPKATRRPGGQRPGGGRRPAAPFRAQAPWRNDATLSRPGAAAGPTRPPGERTGRARGPEAGVWSTSTVTGARPSPRAPP